MTDLILEPNEAMRGLMEGVPVRHRRGADREPVVNLQVNGKRYGNFLAAEAV